MDSLKSRLARNRLLQTLAVGLCAFALVLAQIHYPILSAPTVTLAVPATFAYLVAFAIGWRCLPGLALGTCLATLIGQFGVLDSLVTVVATVLQGVFISAVRHYFPPIGGQVRQLTRLLIAAAGLAVLHGVFIGGVWYMLDRPNPILEGRSAIALAWAATTLFAPVALLQKPSAQSRTILRVIEFGMIIVLTIFAAQMISNDSSPLWLGIPFPIANAFLAVFTWACVRFYLPGSLTVITVSFAILTLNAVVRGTFYPDFPITLSISIQLEFLTGLGILVSVLYLIAAMAGDRSLAAQEITRLHAELTNYTAVLQKQVQESAEKNAFLEAVVAQLPAGVIIVGPAGQILQRNERHRLLFETTNATQLTDLPQRKLSSSGRLRLPYDHFPIVRAIHHGEATDGLSVRAELANGQTTDFHLCATPVRNSEGAIIGAVSVLTDVSERNKTLKQLRESEQKLRVALQSTHMIVAEWHRADGRYVEPEAIVNWFKLPAGTKLKTVMDLLPFVHPEDVDGVRARIHFLMTSDPQSELIFRVRVPNEQDIWILSRSLIQTDESNQPNGMMMSVLVDVTERYQQLDQLRLLESAVVHARDAVIILENQPRHGGGRSVLYVNDAFTKLSGYAAEDVIGRSLHLLRGPNSDATTLEQLRDALDERRAFQCELLNYRKDGSEFWVELSVVPVPDRTGDCSHWVMIQRDVSDRKRADAELRRSQELLAEAQRIAHIGSWEYYRQSEQVNWSDEEYRIFGVEPSEFAPSTKEFFKLIHPDDIVRVGASFQNCLAQNASGHVETDFRIVRPNGEVRHVHEECLVECDSEGNFVRLRGVTQDVTAHRLAQEQLIQAQKMELIGQMAGGIAHDFNNVLTGLIGNLDLVSISPDDPNRRLIDTATRAAFRATDMTRKLLGFARKSQLRTAPISLAPIVAEVIELVGRTTDPRIQLRPAIHTTARVDGDITLLSQVLLNLCLNARDAMPGGGWIEIRVDEETVSPSPQLLSGHTGRFVRLTVEDNGVGIPPDVKAHIFEPFFTTKPVGEGTGLGLPMVHGIIEQHRGWVECYSEVGKGTRFDLYLPVCAELADPIWNTPPALTQTPQPIIDRTKTADERKMTVLLVDDEEMIRELARAVLEANGYTVLEACDGEQAIEVYRERRDEIDLTILDLTMPRLSGQDTFRALMELDREVRVLFSSGYSSETLADTEGAIGLLPKPYRPADLIEAVGSAIHSRFAPVT
jgi:PAS domain S-box-containing protein